METALSGARRGAPSDCETFHLLEGGLIPGPVAELGGPWGVVGDDGLDVLDDAARGRISTGHPCSCLCVQQASPRTFPCSSSSLGCVYTTVVSGLPCGSNLGAKNGYPDGDLRIAG